MNCPHCGESLEALPHPLPKYQEWHDRTIESKHTCKCRQLPYPHYRTTGCPTFTARTNIDSSGEAGG